ncbi:thioredoxin family protein [Sediminibacillus albus]|uniref:Thioredoxin n=1 Tax=Sediminibacillus albus TaxID=407036 RepID=A0A1G8YXJ3_9BACI|nr:thioredoxin family protein [Sediminibacillus albus]SDK07134.1 Thioredoxin [Sediminibacillus albus]
MKHITTPDLEGMKNGLVFIHTPFCGTCQLARKMLLTVESMEENNLFYDMNASLYPNYMQDNQIESVPCLLIFHEGEIKEKVYAFQSVTNIYLKIGAYNQTSRLFPEK